MLGLIVWYVRVQFSITENFSFGFNFCKACQFTKPIRKNQPYGISDLLNCGYL